MTGLPDLETPFRKRARSLPSPLSENFDRAAWDEAFAACEPTLADRNLYRGALWITEKAHRLYAERPEYLNQLGSTGSTILAFALLNREYRILAANARTAVAAAAESGPITMDYATNVRFANAHGQNMSSGDYVEAFIDALEGWLYDAERSPPLARVEASDIDNMASPLIGFYSMRHILKRLYDKALHLGHYIDEDGVWVPHDRAMASLHQAWFARDEAVFSAAPARLFSAWGDMPSTKRREWRLSHSVVEVVPGKQGYRLKVGRVPQLGKRTPQQPLMRIGLRNSHVAEFMDQPLPLEPVLTAAMIEDTWWICADAARSMSAVSARLPEGERTLGRIANSVERSVLVEAIAKALALAPEVAGKLVDFLTYRKDSSGSRREGERGWRGLWTAPLVPVPETEFLVMSPAVFEHCTALYRVEAWLEKGGLSDEGVNKSSQGGAQRGHQFERTYRANLCEALSQNDGLPGSRVAREQIKRGRGKDGFPEQVDILFKLGKRLFVGELKFLLRPADPHQWARHYVKLSAAAKQAKAKAAAVEARRDVTAAALGLDLKDLVDLPVTPIVVLNSGFGFSLEVDGCRVVDAQYLRDFLRSPYFATGGALGRGKLVSEEVTVVYSSEYDAAHRFDAIMAKPGVLIRFLNRINWDVVNYPSSDDKPLRIASPFRGDMTPFERQRRKDLVSDVFY